jgi:hypothetical protein
MNITIEGVDTFTNCSPYYFTVSVNLMEDEFKLFHEDNCIKVYINDEYYVSNKEEFKIY